MNNVECPRCGQPMPSPGTCPVCEHVWEPALPPTGTVRGGDDEGLSPLARWWRSGQIPVAAAGLLLGVGVPLPLVRDVRFVGRTVTVSLYDILQGQYPRVGRFAAWLVVGSVVFLGSMLLSRRTGSAMSASRPMLLVVSVTPLLGAALPFLRLHRYGQDPGVGPAAVLIVVGVVLAFVGALRFGRGVPDPPRRGHALDDD